MPMEDRIAELIRQRARIAEHLQWLDREIARASAQSPLPSQPLSLGDEPAPPSTSPAAASEVLKSLPAQGATEAAATAALPVAAPTVSLLTSVGKAKPAEPASPAAVIGDSRVKDIRAETRSGCLLWVTLGVSLFVVVVVAMIFLGRLMAPPPKDAPDPEAPQKSGVLILPFVEHDARA